MSCAADILAALNITKPANAEGKNAFLHSIATGVADAIISYIQSAVTTACVYTGPVTGSGAGTFTALTASLFITPFENGLKAATDVNNAIGQGFATGLNAMMTAGTVTESNIAGVIVATGAATTFTGTGSSHAATAPAHSGIVSALSRMSSEHPASGTVPSEEELKKLKLMANSLAKVIDDYIPTMVLATAGAGATGAGAATATVPAVDSTFPA